MAALKLFVVVVIVFALASGQTIVNVAGANQKEIRAAFDDFKKLIGGPDNGDEPGPLASGRRSINWDSPKIPFNMPANFFNKDIPRGLKLKTATQEFRVSDCGNNCPGRNDKKFDSINPSMKTQLKRFSSKRLLSAFDRTKITARFIVPGKPNLGAQISAFACVFVDVDLPDTTSIELRGLNAPKDLGTVFAKPSPGGLTFVGIKFDEPVISQVIIKLGNEVLQGGVDDGDRDIVVLDDFLYAEPQHPGLP